MSGKKVKTTETTETVEENEVIAEETRTVEDLNEKALANVEAKHAKTFGDVESNTPRLNLENLRQALKREGIEITDQQLIDEGAIVILQIQKLDEEAKQLELILIDSGWNGAGSALAGARDLILRQNADFQVLATGLHAAGLISEGQSIVEAVMRFIANYAPPIVGKAPEGRLLAKGTTVQLGSENVILAHDVVVNYPDEISEQKFVGMCHHSGNLETNKHNLKFKYNGLGVRLPLEEQVEETEQLPSFIASLSEAEALSFGIEESYWLECGGIKQKVEEITE